MNKMKMSERKMTRKNKLKTRSFALELDIICNLSTYQCYYYIVDVYTFVRNLKMHIIRKDV